jgi:RNase adaptor protein for sRNA GlmZ degradation
MYLEELENYLVDNLGTKMTLELIVEAVKSQIWQYAIAKCDVSKHRLFHKFSQLKNEQNV